MVTGCCGATDSNYPGKVPPFLPERVHIGLGPVGLLGLVIQKLVSLMVILQQIYSQLNVAD